MGVLLEPALGMAKPIHAMTKQEATEYLIELGDQINPAWTSCELKSRIKELLTQRASKVKMGVNIGSKKEVIEKACRDNDVKLTGHETKGDLLRKLREQLEMTAELNGDMVMTIGKHAGKTFAEIQKSCPKYVEWVQTMAAENPEARQEP